MTILHLRPRTAIAIGAGCLLAIACVLSSDTRGVLLDKSAANGTWVKSPVKAHLVDGGMIRFDHGVQIDAVRASGDGMRFTPSRDSEAVQAVNIPLDSVLGFEVYERKINPIRTVVYSSALTAVSTVGAVGLAIIIFGSCPTVYADSAGVQTLQAESFSYSIAPLLAKRDVDRMTIAPDAHGVIRLAVRNEALETHHIDHMEIIELRHRADEMALPSPRGGAIAVSDFDPAPAIRDASGRDVGRLVARADEQVFSTDSGFLRRAVEGGPVEDRLTITVPVRPGADSIGLMLRARSSLLTTSVLYDHLLGRQGALALDWVGQDLTRITTLARLGTWYGKNFGMQVEVQDGFHWRPVIRLMDFGPTAWRTVGVALPAPRGPDDSVRVRLTFAADEFRIDQLALAHHVRRVEQRIVPIARASDSEGQMRPDIVTMLAHADDREVETHPGDQFRIEFDVGQSPSTRTFLFAAQGYYVEWLRPSWMKAGTNRRPFSPSTTSMRDLLRSWKGGKDSLEAMFFTRRVPIL